MTSRAYQALSQVFSHERIIHRFAVRRLAMIPEVGNEQAEMPGESRRDSQPIIRGAQQTMKEHQRVTGTKFLKASRMTPPPMAGLRPERCR